MRVQSNGEVPGSHPRQGEFFKSLKCDIWCNFQKFKRNLVIHPAKFEDFSIEEPMEMLVPEEVEFTTESVIREPVNVIPNHVMTSGLLEMAVAAAGLYDEE